MLSRSVQRRRYGVGRDGAGVASGSALPELRLGLLQQLRLLNEVNGRGAQHLACMDGGPMGQRRLVAGNHLPAVAGHVVGPHRHVDLGRGALVADVAHVGGAGVEGGTLVQRHQKVVEVAGPQSLHLLA